MSDLGIEAALDDVRAKIKNAQSKRTVHQKQVELVAVSKTKPSSLVIEAYNHNHRHFGENYVNELVAKAAEEDVLNKCPDIKWHFIGHLQSNKVNKLLSIANLYMVQTVDSEKLASSLDNSRSKSSHEDRLRVMVQVNTSGESNKSGIHPNEVVNLVKFIMESCSRLQFTGLMTIGLYPDEQVEGPNPDFQSLVCCREKVCKELSLNQEDVELSMGMSHDFENAIEMGSTCVRVGSSIFGSRDYTKTAAGAAS